MGYVVVFKVVQDMGDGVYFVDIGKELVVQIFVFVGVFYQIGDVDEGDVGWDDLFVVGDCGQIVQMWIGYGDFVDIWFDGVKGEVCGLCGGGFCQCVEQC